MSLGEAARRELLESLVACGALEYGEFTLTSGRKSSYYVDIKKAITRPDILRTIASAIAPYASTADRIAGVELGAVPIAAAVALEADRPYVIVRKDPKGHGTRRGFEGELNPGDRVLFVEDVVTTGGTLSAAIERIRGAGATVSDAVAVVDRGEGGRNALGSIGVTLHPLLDARDLLERAR